jgi:hypothetical protein
MRKDMEARYIADEIYANLNLARSLRMNTTPGIIIGNHSLDRAQQCGHRLPQGRCRYARRQGLVITSPPSRAADVWNTSQISRARLELMGRGKHPKSTRNEWHVRYPP